MATKKSPAQRINPKTPENPIYVLKEGTCLTSSGKSTLTYLVGVDESREIHLKVSGNDGGGFWSAEWVAFAAIQKALQDWPEDRGVTSMAFRSIFRGKSANTPGFLIAVLVTEGLLEPTADKKRVHQASDPTNFLATVEALREEAGIASGKKPAAKANAQPKAKTKPAPKPKAKAPRKVTTSSTAK